MWSYHLTSLSNLALLILRFLVLNIETWDQLVTPPVFVADIMAHHCLELSGRRAKHDLLDYIIVVRCYYHDLLCVIRTDGYPYSVLGKSTS